MKNIFVKTASPYRGGILKEALIQKRGNRCEQCGLEIWNNQPIPLEAHHIDGDRCNNLESNLLLLCPNCHTFTPNYGSKNCQIKEVSDEELIEALQNHSTIRQALFSLGMSDAGANYKRVRSIVASHPELQILKEQKFQKYNICPICGKYISKNATYCEECNSIAARIVERPSREELKTLIRTQPFTKIGDSFGVTDNAVRKWCDMYNLPRKKIDIKSFSDEDWEKL